MRSTSALRRVVAVGVAATLLVACSSNDTPVATDAETATAESDDLAHGSTTAEPADLAHGSTTAEPADLAHGSWAEAIENANLLVDLDKDARKLLSVFPTGAGNKISELDIAGSNPSYFDQFGPALWRQCERVDVYISIDPSIDAGLRASARTLTVNAILELNKLTGLTLVVRSGATEQHEEFFDPTADPDVPGFRELDVFWYDTASDAPPDRFGIADAWHSGPDALQQPTIDGSVNVTSKDAPTQQASLLRSRISLSIEILHRLPGRVDLDEDSSQFAERSQSMAVLHELAHVVGIGHSTETDSFMYPSFSDQTRMTTPDRATLALAGSRPC